MIQLICQKAFQMSNTALVWKGRLFSNNEQKNIYVLLGPSLSIVYKKPETIPHGGLTALLRKHQGSFSFRKCFHIKTDETNEHILPCYRVSSEDFRFFFRIQKNCIEFCHQEEKTSYFRIQNGRIYTKKKTCLPFTIDQSKEITDEFFSDLLTTQVPEKIRVQTEEAEKLSFEQKELKKQLKRRLKTIEKSLKKQQVKILSSEQIATLKGEAEALKCFSYLYNDYQETIVLKSQDTGLKSELNILNKKKLSKGRLIDSYFQKVKKAEKGFDLLAFQREKTEKSIAQFRNALDNIPSDPIEISILIKKLKLKSKPDSKKTSESTTKSPFFHFIHKSNNAEFHISRSAENADVMLKKTRSQDHWFHLVSGEGSHVVVVCKKLTEEIRTQAGIFAVHYSKQRKNMEGEIYQSQRRHLKKSKGMKAGLWQVNQAKTFHIKYSAEQLKELQTQCQA